MRSKLIIAALTAATLGTTAPALAGAQGYQSDRYGGQYDSNAFWQDAPRDPYQRISWLQRRIDRGVSDGSLTRAEARRSQAQLDGIRRDAARYRTRGGYISPANSDRIQARLDDLSRGLRFDRGNDRFATNYDARRDYRDDPRYEERTLSANDQVYRGSDNRYYCKRSDGTTGLIVGAAGGGILGNVIDGGHNRVAGTLIGGALGALVGKSVDQNQSQVRCR